MEQNGTNGHSADRTELMLEANEQALMSEYMKAIDEMSQRRTTAKSQLYDLQQAEAEVVNNLRGTVRTLVRQHELTGDWRPSEDGSKLIRVQGT